MDRETKIRVLIGATLIIFAAAGNYLRFSSTAGASSLGLDQYELENRGGAYEIEPIDTGFLDMLGAREVSFRTYGGEERVWVFLGYFDRQKEGSQVHSPKHCYPGSGWSILSESDVEAPWGKARLKRLVVSNGSENRLVYYWFQTSDRVLNNVFSLKYYLTRQAVLRHHQDVVFARVSTAIGGGENAAEDRLREYSLEIQQKIGELFDRRVDS
jgi:EpsI family protein